MSVQQPCQWRVDNETTSSMMRSSTERTETADPGMLFVPKLLKQSQILDKDDFYQLLNTSHLKITPLSLTDSVTILQMISLFGEKEGKSWGKGGGSLDKNTGRFHVNLKVPCRCKAHCTLPSYVTSHYFANYFIQQRISEET